MLEVKFYDSIDDSLLKFAVIISQSNGKWVFCKHKERAHLKCREDTEKQAKTFLKQLKGSYRRKQELLSLILS